MRELEKRKILLCLTGSIACYKAAELARALVKEGAIVKTIMTEAAQRFISPITFETLTGEPVYTDMFSRKVTGIEHIELSRFAELIVIAPASYNTIGKIASGVADNLLLSVVASSRSPVVIVPAMNPAMYENPIIQDKIDYLRAKGYHFVEPEYGELACGEIGKGRFPKLERIIDKVKCLLLGDEKFKGTKILITLGRTIEPIDPVRYISNYSSGKMGYWLVSWAKRMGASVFVVSGLVEIELPFDVLVYNVRSVEEMKNRVMEFYDDVDVVIMAAAVADFKLERVQEEKIKREKEQFIKLVPTVDILEELGKRKRNQILVGFSLEREENLFQDASRKLKEKNLDLIFANDIKTPGEDYVSGLILDRDFQTYRLENRLKCEAAKLLLEKIYELREKTR